MKENERTFKMKENFMDHHREGLTIAEIAKLYDLSTCTFYGALQTIADKHGATRAFLLKVPHAEHAAYVRTFAQVKPIDLKEFHQKMQSIASQMEETLAFVDQAIEDQEQLNREFEEELR